MPKRDYTVYDYGHKVEVVETPDLIYNAAEVGANVLPGIILVGAALVFLLIVWLVKSPIWVGRLLIWAVPKAFHLSLILLMLVSEVVMVVSVPLAIKSSTEGDTKGSIGNFDIFVIGFVVFGISYLCLRPKWHRGFLQRWAIVTGGLWVLLLLLIRFL